MAKEYFVTGIFDQVEATTCALSQLKSKGLGEDLEYYAPFPDHGLEEEKYEGKKRSPVRRFTLLGALTGCLGAFTFTSWMSLDYPLRVSAKPLLSYPAFVVIGFECTILLGGIFTLLSMFHFCRIPNLSRPVSFKKPFTEDKFGVAVKVEKDKAEELKSLLSSAGATQVDIDYAG